MKKFLIIILIAVVISSIGLLTYNFFTSNEIINVSASTIYANIGDEIDIEEYIVRKNAKNNTVVEVDYDSQYAQFGLISKDPTDTYKFKVHGAGEVVLKINSNLKDFSPLTITVRIGNGEESTPFYIFNESQLVSIGAGGEYNIFAADKHYRLTSDIVLTSNFTPICSNDTGFSGTFNMNGYTISNVLITGDYDYAGLFGKLNQNAQIRNGIINNFTFNGSAKYVGTLAGYNEGNISLIQINGTTINNNSTESIACSGGLLGYSSGKVTKAEVKSFISGDSSMVGSDSTSVTYIGNTGGFVGKIEKKNDIDAEIILCSVSSVNVISGTNIGGFIAENVGGQIANIYVRSAIAKANSATRFLGGILAVNNGMEYVTSLVNSYSLIESYNISLANSSIIVDPIIASNNQTASDIVHTNIIFGTYYYVTTNNNSVSTKLVNSNFVHINKIDTTTTGILGTTLDTKKLALVSGVIEVQDEKFSTNIWNFVEGSLPTLNMEATIPVISLIRSGAEIVNVLNSTEFLNAFNDSTIKEICLGGDIEIDGTFNINFNKKLNGNGYKISASNTLTNGIFTSVSGTIDNVVFKNIKVSSTGNAGIITPNLTGVITNCYFDGCTITSSTAGVNIGLVAGTNNGDISNLVVLKNCSITYSGTDINTSTNIGFIAGNNISNISSVIIGGNSNQIWNKEVSKVYLGGIAGSNEGVIRNVVIGKDKGENPKKLILDTNYSNALSLAGGVAGYNSSRISNASISGNFEVANFGGIVAESFVTNGNEQYVIKNCSVNSDVIATAMNAGGLVYKLGAGTIQYSRTTATINGVANDSKVCGFAHTLGFYKSNNARVINSFSSSVLAGQGRKFYETQSVDWRGTVFGLEDSGYINKSPYNISTCSAERVDTSWVYTYGTLIPFLADAWEELPKNETECLGRGLIDYLGDDSIWNYSNESGFPELVALSGEFKINMDTLFDTASNKCN